MEVLSLMPVCKKLTVCLGPSVLLQVASRPRPPHNLFCLHWSCLPGRVEPGKLFTMSCFPSNFAPLWLCITNPLALPRHAPCGQSPRLAAALCEETQPILIRKCRLNFSECTHGSLRAGASAPFLLPSLLLHASGFLPCYPPTPTPTTTPTHPPAHGAPALTTASPPGTFLLPPLWPCARHPGLSEQPAPLHAAPALPASLCLP